MTMKKIVVISILLLTDLCVFAQKTQDVVYLKSGAVIRGQIIEQVPQRGIKLQTADGSIFVHSFEEIDRIAKESMTPPASTTEPTQSTMTAPKGYLALTLGVALPSGDMSKSFSSGFHLNLLQFGYLFTPYFGITATGSGFSSALKNAPSGFNPLACGNLMVGPMFSIPASERFNIDFRPMIGYTLAVPFDKDQGGKSGTAVSYDMGISFRFHTSNKVSLLVGADYFYSKPELTSGGYKYSIDIKELSATFGVGLRLR
jgi:hypothetical protein